MKKITWYAMKYLLILLLTTSVYAAEWNIDDFVPCQPTVVSIYAVGKMEVSAWDEEIQSYDLFNKVRWWVGEVKATQAMFYWDTTPPQQERIQKPEIGNIVIVPASGTYRLQQGTRIVGTAIMVKE